jgi:hypothetical protein
LSSDPRRRFRTRQTLTAIADTMNDIGGYDLKRRQMVGYSGNESAARNGSPSGFFFYLSRRGEGIK